MWLQLYFDLAQEREKLGLKGKIAIVRIEQLCPFPFDLVMRELRRYPNADVYWSVTLSPPPLPSSPKHPSVHLVPLRDLLPKTCLSAPVTLYSFPSCFHPKNLVRAFPETCVQKNVLALEKPQVKGENTTLENQFHGN